MKKTLVMFIPVVVLLCVAATRVGLFLPVLQSNMDANTFSVTNLTAVWVGNNVQINSNTPASWPAVPVAPGASAIVNSNAFPYMLVSTNGTGGGSATWTGTNKIGW